MDKEWIVHKFDEYVVLFGNEEMLERLADDIAQAHEEEVAAARMEEQRRWKDELAIMPCGHHASNAVSTDEDMAHCEMCELERQNEKLRELDSVVSDLGPWVSDGSLSPVEVVLRIDDLIEAQQDDIYGLQAQAALMAELLETCSWALGIVESEGLDDTQEVRDRIEAALADAPEVLRSMEGEIIHLTNGLGTDARHTIISGTGCDIDGHIGGHGNQAQFIVLAKPEKEE